jgi:GAF domain-containing protein
LLQQGLLKSAVNIIECQQLRKVTDPQYPFRHHASIPIRAGNLMLGNLNLVTPSDRAFPENELRMFTAIGDQIGVAVERMRLLEQVKAQRIEEQAALLRLSQALLVESEPQAMMDAVAQMTAKSLKVEFAAIALIDEDGQSYSLRSSVGWPPEAPQQAQHVPLSADTAVAHSIRTRAPAIIPDHAQETRFGTPPILTHLGIASSLFVPMLVTGEPIGGLGVNSHTRRDWSNDEVRLLSLIANETAQALTRAWQHAHAVERLERISALHDIDVAIMSQLDLEKRLDILLEKVTERLRVDATAVALIDPDTHELNYAARRGLNGEFFADGFLKVKEGIAGRVAHSGEVAAIPDVRLEPRFVRRDLAEQLGIVSYLAVPLKVRGAIIGVLELATRERHEFLPEEIDFFVTLAGQAAIALENARLFEEARRRAAQQGALAETAGAILATLQVEALWPAVMTAVQETLSADRAAVYLYDPAADRVTCPHASGLSDEYVAGINRLFREIPGGRLLADPRPVVIADAQTDPATAPIRDLITREGFHSYAVFPLIAPEGALGALVAYRDLVAPFSQNDIATGQMLTHIVAVATQNARLFKAERVAREQAELLREAAQAVSGTLNLDGVVRRILAQLKRVLTYDTASVLLLGETGKPTLVTGAGYVDEAFTSRAASDVLATSPILAQMVRDLKPVIIADVRDHPGWIWVPGAEHVRSFLTVPIVTRQRMIGALMMDSAHLDFFDETHARLAGTLAQHISVAIQNARLFESLANEQHNTALLYHLSLELAANLDPKEVANRALLAASETVGTGRGNILALEEDGERLRLLAVTGYDRETVEALNQRLNWDIHRGVTGRVVRTRTAAIVPDVSRDADWVPISGLDDWVQSMLSVPLVAGNKVVGALNLLGERLDFFKIENLSLLTAIASPVALSLQNARLYESLRQRLAELEILAVTSSALRKTQSHDDIPPILLAKAVEGLKANAGVLLLLDNDELKFVATHGATGVSKGGVCPPGAGMMWQALESDKPLFIPDVTQIEELQKNVLCQALMGDALSCACVPLRTTASAIGVVYLNWKKKSFLSADESRLLESLAEIAANAIHRSTLHEQTARQALDLTQAYDATIEGWSRALDLRDRETEGHTQRVTDLTLKLARAIGLREPELAHIRRGALLHDIGKIGIPDSILRKTGALTKEEWDLMCQHPQIAYDMISRIAYLQPALDIPFFHHEKWDGNGYPKGLKGEQIPLVARIFAVADVFDALTSDRPYRPAWTKRKATAYIRQQAEIHFDPKVVEIFLKMIGKKFLTTKDTKYTKGSQ